MTGWFLIGLATAAKAEGKILQAARLLGLAESLHDKTAAMDQKRQIEYEDTLRKVREYLGEDAFTIAKTEGSKLSLEQLKSL